MSQKKNERNAIWLYAVILFTSAFIVLLLTAYSQIKFNKNLNDYKNQISTQESDKNNFKNNLGTALSENKKLSDELQAAKRELEDSKAKVEEGNAALKKQQQKSTSAINTYDILIKAQVEYDKGNLVESADILYNMVDSKLLGKAGVDLYESLIAKVYNKAAETLYQQGYQKYVTRQYDEAIKMLRKSYDYASDEYFSDDCLYFIAYSRYRQENFKEAKEYADKLIKEYPDSNYKRSATDLLQLMGF